MNIVISGASNGIGLACVQLFLQQGHTVHGIDVMPSPVRHAAYTHHVADVREPLPDIADVQVLVTAAGVQSPEADCVDVNLLGTVRTVQRYAMQPAIRAVVTIASASAHNGAEFALYSASKGGVLAYTKHLAQQLAAWGATANSISPGGVLTTSNAPVLNDSVLRQEAMNEALLGKWAEPEEIAQWVYFVAVVNRSMTGQDLLIDNGEMLKANFVWPKDATN